MLHLLPPGGETQSTLVGYYIIDTSEMCAVCSRGGGSGNPGWLYFVPRKRGENVVVFPSLWNSFTMRDDVSPSFRALPSKCAGIDLQILYDLYLMPGLSTTQIRNHCGVGRTAETVLRRYDNRYVLRTCDVYGTVVWHCTAAFEHFLLGLGSLPPEDIAWILEQCDGYSYSLDGLCHILCNFGRYYHMSVVQDWILSAECPLVLREGGWTLQN